MVFSLIQDAIKQMVENELINKLVKIMFELKNYVFQTCETQFCSKFNFYIPNLNQT